MREVSREVLVGFVSEARGHLPRILDRLAALRRGERVEESAREAARLFHSLRGTAGMVGLDSLADVARRGESVFERESPADLAAAPGVIDTLGRGVALIEACLDAAMAGSLDQPSVYGHGVRLFSKIEGRSAGEDAAEIERLLQATADAAPRELAPAAAQPLGDELSAELAEVFREEAEENLAGLTTGLEALRREPGQRRALREVGRLVHNLKGAAGSIGLSHVSELAHRMEDLLDGLRERERNASESDLDLLARASDLLDGMISGGGEVEPRRSARVLAELLARTGDVVGEPASGAGSPVAPIPVAVAGTVPPVRPPRREAEPATPARETVRVPLNRLDELVRLMSGLVVERTVFEQRLRTLTETVKELELSGERLRSASGRLGADYEVPALLAARQSLGSEPAAATSPWADRFDELEMDRYTDFHLITRQVAEASSDIQALEDELRQSLGELQGHSRRLGRLSEDLQEKLMGARLVPVSSLAPRLHRTVRTTAREAGKSAELEIVGGQVELDKAVLDRLSDPLTHLLRNAVDHGIEAAAERRAAGKAEAGRVRLEFEQEGNTVVVRVADDGAGLDLERIRRKAVSAGILSEEAAAAMRGEELRSLIFSSGLSTAARVTEVSGRGVGLDVVWSSVEDLTGTVRVSSPPEGGTLFTIRLPVTLAVTRALLVEVADQTYAVPLGSVLRTERVLASDIVGSGFGARVRVGDRSLRAVSLRTVLGISEDREPLAGERLAALIIAAEGEQVALLVDRFLNGRDIVLKRLGLLLRRVRGVVAATLLGEGSVALVLDPVELVRPTTVVRPPSLQLETSVAVSRQKPRVIIADDSVGVRRMLSTLMSSQGWQPTLARDGQEAIEVIQQADQVPDLLLLDLEMPRLDGYEVTALLRSDTRTRELPIVVITSRAGDKHREQAMSLGVDEYVVKPYQSEVLLAAIDRSLARKATPVAGAEES